MNSPGHSANDLTATTILKWRQHKQISTSPASDFAKVSDSCSNCFRVATFKCGTTTRSNVLSVALSIIVTHCRDTICR